MHRIGFRFALIDWMMSPFSDSKKVLLDKKTFVMKAGHNAIIMYFEFLTIPTLRNRCRFHGFEDLLARTSLTLT